jgi:tripartite-type tricarboxylate transporter receptor subunit TctC
MNTVRYLCLGFSIAICTNVAAQDIKSRTVSLILPYAAGGGVDLMGRAFAKEASRISGQSWVVVNRDGAAGVIGFTALSKSVADGATLVFAPASALTNAPFLTKSMPFKNEQIEPVCQVFENVFAIAVKPDSPIKSLQDLIAQAKASPGKLSYGHAGAGSVPHLAIASVEKALGIKFNAIAFRGDGAMLPQLMGGHIDFGAPGISSIGGKGLRVLATLAEQRHPALPDTPALTELGYPAVTPGLNGLYAPAGTSKENLEQLQTLCKQTLESEDFKKSAATLQQTPSYLPAVQFKARIDKTFRSNAELIPDLNLEKN